MRELVDETAASLGQLFRTRGADCVITLPEDNLPVLVDVDRDRIKQVIINLLSNAVKFVPEGNGRITVRLSRSDGFAIVAVHDNGPGIPEAYQEIIFERFRQGGNTMTDKPQGTGLGLPISREIIEHFGGKLWVESTTGGTTAAGDVIESGSTFLFTIPLSDA